MDSTGRLRQMARALRLYYYQGCSQGAIASELGVSRSTVSRMLAEARETGLVEVRLHLPWMNDSRLEAALIRRFGLKDARVLIAEGLDDTEFLPALGAMGAQLVESYLEDGMTLALSRGSGVYAAVQALRRRPGWTIRVVQMQGALGDRLLDGSDAANYLASLYGGTFHFVSAPMVLESKSARDALIQEPSIRETLELARRADLALVGIGCIDPCASSMSRSGLVTRAELAGLAERGIVGDVSGLLMDANGHVPGNDFNSRLVCIDVQSLRRIPRVIGVAGGPAKVAAIRAALRGGLVNMLATDSIVAAQLLGGD